MMSGVVAREDREWSRVAWMTAALLNVSGKSLKRTVTADELLGRKKQVVPKDPAADMEAVWRRVEESWKKEMN